MSLSLIEELPKIVAEGKKEVERILERLSSPNKLTLQINEYVLPSKDKSGLFRGHIPEFKPREHSGSARLQPSRERSLYRSDSIGTGSELPVAQVDSRDFPKTFGRFGGVQTQHHIAPTIKSPLSPLFQRGVEGIEGEWVNRLSYGDNLLVMQALLAGDAATGLPSLRGKIDLIYIDPPFDSKADYRTKVTLPGTTLEQKPTVIEQAAYSDTWKDGTVSYLKMMYPRLALMRELLSEQGSIYVHIDWHVGHYVKVIMDEIFGKENFVNEIIWHYRRWTAPANNYQRLHDTLFWYAKNSEKRIYNTVWVTPANVEKGRNESYELDENGKLFRWQSLNGKRYKIYRDEKGVHAGDVWDIWVGSSKWTKTNDLNLVKLFPPRQ